MYLKTYLIMLFILAASCNESAQEDNQDQANETSNADQDSDSDSSENQVVYANAYYTSFDGTNDFSLLLLGENTNWTIEDESIAIVEEAEINISTENLDTLLESRYEDFKKVIEERCQGNANPLCQDFSFETYKERFSSNFRVQKITPLKSGITKLISSSRFGRGTSETKHLVITGFSPEDFLAGQERYSTLGEGNLKACESCHLSGEKDAPPHSLGRVKDFSDDAILAWITTGEFDGTKAKIPHTWEFANDRQRIGIIPYLRSLQAKDVNTLSEQYIGEIEGEFEDGIGGSN